MSRLEQAALKARCPDCGASPGYACSDTAGRRPTDKGRLEAAALILVEDDGAPYPDEDPARVRSGASQ